MDLLMLEVLLRVQQLTLAPRMEHYGVLQIGDQIRHTRAARNNILTLRELLGQPLVHREGGGLTDTAQRLPTMKIWSM